MRSWRGMLLPLALLAVPPSLAAEPAEYPLEQLLRPMVLPKGVGRVALDSRVDTLVTPRIGGAASLWSGLQGTLGLGRVELGLTTGAMILPDPYWGHTLAPSARFSVVDGSWFDLAPSLALATVIGGRRVVYPTLVFDPGLRIDVAGAWLVRIGHADDAWTLANTFRYYGVALPLVVGFAWQGTERVALSAGASLGTVEFSSIAVEHPVWEEPNGELGVQVAPGTDVDVEGVGGFRGFPDAYLALHFGVAVSSRW